MNRLIVVAPTRSTCVNISVVLQNGEIPGTLLTRECGGQIEEAVSKLGIEGFGIVAGTGTGKTVAIRDIAKQVLGTALSVDIVTRENEATAYTWTCNVLVVTPGVALNWVKAGRLFETDLVVLDEVHQTSEHLELTMALAKRNGSRFVWMSATIDPSVYQEYLMAGTVIRCSAYDPTKRSEVTLVHPDDDRKYQRGWRIGDEIEPFLKEKVGEFIAKKRGVAVFVSTRAKAEELARTFSQYEELTSDFYHGGESAEKLKRFLTGEVTRPFMIFMTSAGASSLNITGLDTVVILDEIYTQSIVNGVKVLKSQELGANELLQMGGRVNGRCAGSQIYILTERNFDFHGLKPVQPEFVLGGDLKRVALTCARVGVDLSDLDVIGHINHTQYGKEVARFIARGLIAPDGLSLTEYGAAVERLPVEPDWGEMIVHAQQEQDEELLDVVIVCASFDQLYSLIRKGHNFGYEMVVRHSDHLTGYNVIASALSQFGRMRDDDSEYILNGDFRKWCKEEGYQQKTIREASLAILSICRSLDIQPLNPQHFELVDHESRVYLAFLELLAKVQSFDYVRNSRFSAFYGEVYTAERSRTIGQSVLGRVRYWTAKRGHQCASVEGTEIPEELVQKYATKRITRFLSVEDNGNSLYAEMGVTFAGETIESEGRACTTDIPENMRLAASQVFLGWLADQMV